MSRTPNVEAEIDRLHALPLAEFVKARGALAARLARAGRGADAARVKAARKPSGPAWAVNQLRFSAPKILGALLAAGDRLRGKAGDRQEAMLARRDALAAARGKIEAILAAGGPAATPDLLRRVAATLEAVVAHGSATGRPAVGRLTEDLPAPGFDEIAALGLFGHEAQRRRPARKPDPPRPAPRPAPRPPSRPDPARALATLAAAEKKLDAARRRQEKLESALSLAMRRERKLREEVAAARKAVDQGTRPA